MRIEEKIFRAMPAHLQALFEKLPNPGSEEVLAAFPDAVGQIADASSSSSRKTQNVYGDMKRGNEASAQIARAENNKSAARFFYCAKASRADRNEGCEGLEERPLAYGNQAQAEVKRGNTAHAGNSGMNTVKMRGNNHPTVKPTELMRWLCRLVTPAGGTVLDPFMGSGSTGKAAALEGFRFVGIEQRAEYLEISSARIGHAQQHAREKAAQLELTLNAGKTPETPRAGNPTTRDAGAAQGRAESRAGGVAGPGCIACADSVGAGA